MNKNVDGMNTKLEAMTIAMSEWQRLEHMSLDELEANRNNYKTPYDVGDKFKVGINLGEQGFFDEGKCNSLTGKYASESANCFKDTIMTVYDKSGSAMYTTRSLPLSVSQNSFPEGTIFPYTGDLAKIPKGWVLCDGTNGTPDLTGKFLEGTKTKTGEFHSAGLPNITGIYKNVGGPVGASGAFYLVSSSRVRVDSGVIGGNEDAYFDASRSNSIYGNSNTVQPPSYTVFYIMKTNKDFHYAHTNPAPSPEYYTKDEIDKKFVHSDNPSNRLSLKYDASAKKMKAFVDGTEVPLNSQDSGTSPEIFNDNGGYYKFSSGLIMQWGNTPIIDTERVIYEEYNKYIVKFPIKFPNKLLSASVSLEMHGAQPTGNNSIYIYEQNSSGLWGIVDTGAYTSNAHINQSFGAKAHWFAIGY